MKRLAKNSDVAHAYAHQLYETARNSNKSFWFVDDSIYSYQTKIGYLINDGFKNIFLRNVKKYSITTSCHQGLLDSSCFGVQIDVYDEESLEDYIHCAEKFDEVLQFKLKKLQRARNKERWVREIKTLCDDIRKMVDLELIEVSNCEKCSEVFKKVLNGEKVFDESVLEKIRKEKVEKIKKDEKKLKKSIERFEKYEIDRIDFVFMHYSTPTYIRLSQDNKRIETSKQVQIPLKLALNLYLEYVAVKNGTFKGKRTEKILDFKINISDSFKDDSIVIGCHDIPISEMKRVYKELEKKGLLTKLLKVA